MVAHLNSRNCTLVDEALMSTTHTKRLEPMPELLCFLHIKSHAVVPITLPLVSVFLDPR